MNTQPIYVFAKWQVAAGKLDTVLALLHQVAQESRKEPGNLHYRAHQSIAEPGLIMIYEGYANEAAVEAHRNTPHYQDIVAAKIIPLLESREVVLAKPLGD